MKTINNSDNYNNVVSEPLTLIFKTYTSLISEYLLFCVDNVYIQKSEKKLGLNSDILLDDGSVVLVYVKNKIPASNKDISDVRGKVISDYQSYLEDQWIGKLRKKYSIKINKEVLYSLVKN